MRFRDHSTVNRRPAAFGLRAIFALVLCCSMEIRAEEKKERDVHLGIPVSYGRWRVDDGAWRLGPSTVSLADGEHIIAGKLGWKLTVRTEAANLIPVSTKPGRHGRDLSGLLFYGNRLTLPSPPGRRVVLSIPDAAGKYRIKHLLRPGTGDRAVHLSPGSTRVQGPDWAFNVLIGENDIETEWADEEKAGGEERPALLVQGMIIAWPSETQTSDLPETAELRMRIARERATFTRGEFFTLGVSAALPEALSGTVRIVAVREENGGELEFSNARWTLPAGRWTRQLDIDAALFKPGEYTLRAEFGELSATCPLTVVRSLPQRPSQALAVLTESKKARGPAGRGCTGVVIPTGPLAGPGDARALRDRLQTAAEDAMETYLLLEQTAGLTGADDDAAQAREAARAAALAAQLARTFGTYRGAIAAPLFEPPAVDAAAVKDELFLPEAAAEFFPAVTTGWDALRADGPPLPRFFVTAKQAGEGYADGVAKAWDAIAAIRRGTTGTATYAWLPSGEDDGDAVTVPAGESTVVDLIAATSTELTLDEATAFPPQIEGEWAGSEAKPHLYAILPRRPEAIQVSARLFTDREHLAGLRIRAHLLNEAGRASAATLPATVTVSRNGEAGEATEIARQHRAFAGGRLECVVDLAANHADGPVRVEVNCPSLAIRGEVPVHVRIPRRHFDAHVRLRTDLELEDRRALLYRAQNFTEPVIVIGSAAHLPAARRIAARFPRTDGRPDVRFVNEVARLQAAGPEAAKRYGPGLRIDGPVILLGCPGDNELIEELTVRWQLTRLPVTPDCPGPGKSLIQYAWRAFSPDHDALILAAGDPETLRSATDRFLELAGR